MGFVVRTSKRPEKRVVPVEGLDGCTLTVREPKRIERLEQWLVASHAAPVGANGNRDVIAWDAALWDYRVRVVCDWSGFVDDQQVAIPFSQSMLEVAMAQNEEVQTAAVKAANNSFKGIGEQDEKNSVAPSVVG